jgi:ornithine cyclodeaminase/alanine dehydrogenase-like protein (mu-crystallin family)
VIEEPSLRRRSEQDISLADLTGVAVQDMAIAELALQGLRNA